MVHRDEENDDAILDEQVVHAFRRKYPEVFEYRAENSILTKFWGRYLEDLLIFMLGYSLHEVYTDEEKRILKSLIQQPRVLAESVNVPEEIRVRAGEFFYDHEGWMCDLLRHATRWTVPDEELFEDYLEEEVIHYIRIVLMELSEGGMKEFPTNE